MEEKCVTAVYVDGEYRVSQYCSHLGYPRRAGIRLLRTLENLDLEKLRLACLQCTGTSLGEAERRLREVPGWVEPLWYSEWVGPEILSQIVLHGIRDLLLYPTLFYNSFTCDWVYVVDFDTGTFEVYHGGNHEPVSQDERFYSEWFWEAKNSETKQRFYPVRLVASWPLDRLPDWKEFLDKLEPLDQDAPGTPADQVEQEDSG